MTMSNLTPEYRTDKNGRRVLRHVKSDSSAAATTVTKIPAVSMKTPERSSLLTEATETLAASIRKNFPESTFQNDMKKAAPALATYSDATLSRIQSYPWSYLPARRLLRCIASEWTETTANDYMAASIALDPTGGSSISIMHTDSWQLYPELHSANNEGDYPAERLNQIIALYRVTECMEADDLEPYSLGERSYEPEAMYIDDDDLRAFVLNPEEPYDREDIVGLITTHHIYDVAHIKSMLNSGITSLSGGIL